MTNIRNSYVIFSGHLESESNFQPEILFEFLVEIKISRSRDLAISLTSLELTNHVWEEQQCKSIIAVTLGALRWQSYTGRHRSRLESRQTAALNTKKGNIEDRL